MCISVFAVSAYITTPYITHRISHLASCLFAMNFLGHVYLDSSLLLLTLVATVVVVVVLFHPLHHFNFFKLMHLIHSFARCIVNMILHYTLQWLVASECFLLYGLYPAVIANSMQVVQKSML